HRRQPPDRVERHRRANDASVCHGDARRDPRSRQTQGGAAGRGELKMRRMLGLLCCVSILLVGSLEAKIKVRAEPDPNYDFATVKTWMWDADAGDIMMARTQSDEPAAVKARVEPMIRTYVEQEMTKKGLRVAAPGATPA